MRHVAGLLLWTALLVGAGCGGGGGTSGDGDDGGGPFGLDQRVAPSGLDVPVGAAGGGGLQVTPVDAFPSIRIQGGTALTGAGDGTNRLFVADRGGVIHTFPNSAAAQATRFLDLTDRVDSSAGEAGLLGLAFDPRFASNGFFYVSYVALRNGTRTVRLSRFSASGNTASRASERIVFEYPHPEGYHFGGWIGFGPDGMLYLSTGDNGTLAAPQRTDNLLGKVLRLRIDAQAGTASAPPDNPFGNLVWATGFRNPWRCSFDRAGNGDLYCGDVGESDHEEIDLVRRGRNYGWPYFEGPQAYVEVGRHDYASFEPPLHHYPHSVGVAVIGGHVYRGSAVPALAGRYLFTDFATPTLWALSADGRQNAVASPALPDIRSFGEDDQGELHALSGQSGVIYRFVPAAGGGPVAPMPARLSGTGLFTDTAALAPAPSLIDYSVNAPFWSDGASKRRWFVLPAGERIGFAADGAWQFPVGTITVKQFDLGTTRVETRVMVRRADGWAGFSYRWRADQRDADLVPEAGASADVAGGQRWLFPSRAQCLSCHTQAAGRALGLNTRQFNRSHAYAATGRSDNQLRTLAHVGVFAGEVGAASQYAALPDPRDGAAPLALRAKAWLDTNCAGCHQPGGPTPVDMDLRWSTPLDGMRLVGVASSQTAGATRVVARNAGASDLWQRVAGSGANRMPPLGVSVVDAEAVQLLAAWIDGLN